VFPIPGGRGSRWPEPSDRTGDQLLDQL
jgi:hypothetical protein